jgi:hypothetical protein
MQKLILMMTNTIDLVNNRITIYRRLLLYAVMNVITLTSNIMHNIEYVKILSFTYMAHILI